MNDTELQNALKALLEDVGCMDNDDLHRFGLPDEVDEIEHVRTFDEAGVLTPDAGLVITTASGGEFQLTIVRSH